MKKLLAVIFLSILFFCSNDSENNQSSCECETIQFRYVISASQNQFGEFTEQHCLSYWKNPDFFNLEIDESTNPPTVTGVTEAIFDVTKTNVPCD